MNSCHFITSIFLRYVDEGISSSAVISSPGGFLISIDESSDCRSDLFIFRAGDRNEQRKRSH